ncbi:MAG TPA: ABC transporter permease [Actinomycetota bacterium]|nr:ABC transporter permease [Actinomycetota bacterium]
MNATKVVHRNYLVFWRGWRSSAVFSFLNPLLFLGAMGFGIGTLLGRENMAAFGGVGYLEFFSTGMLAATCMQSATFAATYPIMAKIRWYRNYEAMLSTPLQVRDLFFGELAWISLTQAIVAIPFFLVMVAFGVPETPLAILAIPVAVLVGLNFGAAVMAYTATLESDTSYNWLFRFVITPLFLFSGTFFPIDDLPRWAASIANAIPLYHGIELIRGLTFGDLEPGAAAWHLAFLVVFFGVATAVGIRNFHRRLIP